MGCGLLVGCCGRSAERSTWYLIVVAAVSLSRRLRSYDALYKILNFLQKC